MTDDEVLDDLIARLEILHQELNVFKEHLVSTNGSHAVRFGGFDSTIKHDLTKLTKLRNADGCARSARVQELHSSNVPNYEMIWSIVKQSTGLVALSTDFFWSAPPPRCKKKGKIPSKQAAGRDHGVQVDVITENGTEWIKVNSLTECRLRGDIDEEGLAMSDADSDEDSPDRRDDVLGEDTSIPILKLAYDLMRAAKTNRVRHQRPRVRMILPRMAIPSMIRGSRLVHKILDRIRQMGIDLQVGPIPKAPSIQDALPKLLRLNENARLTPTLNMDTTVMLALISDISHGHANEDRLRHPEKIKQLECEKKDELLSRFLYPAIGDRFLVCTQEAMRQMWSIVTHVANMNEKRRAELLFTDDPELSSDDKASRRAEFASLSVHSLPIEFKFPILVIPKDAPSPDGDVAGYLSSLAEKIVPPDFADHNASVFLHGWRTGRTTLTSNSKTAKQIMAVIERARLEAIVSGELAEDDHVSGPSVWLSPISRSLAGMTRGGLKPDAESKKSYTSQTVRDRTERQTCRPTKTGPGVVGQVCP